MTVRRRSLLAASLVAACSLAVGAGFFFALRPAQAGGTFAVTLLVVDANGKPVAGAEASRFWIVDKGVQTPSKGVISDPTGRASLTLDDSGAKHAILVFSADRKHGGRVAAGQAEAGQELRVSLGPTSRVTGTFTCDELGTKPDWAITYISDAELGPRSRFLQNITNDARLEFTLPAGKYSLNQYGTGIVTKNRPLEVAATGANIDLGAIDFPADILAKIKGKTPPALTITEARGVDKNVKLADYKGKWVLLDFWGYWCGPCVAGSIPTAISFQKMYAEHADKFVILALHGSGAKTLAELDAKLPPIREKYWNGEELPFPVLLDGTEETAKRYGVDSWPTTLLIDPQGVLVGYGTFEELAKKLPPIPAAKAWAACRDNNDNYAIGNDTDIPLTPAGFAKQVARRTYCPVELDAGAVRAAGLDPDKPLPTIVVGWVFDFRSRVELFLEPHALGVSPSADGSKLLITKSDRIGGEATVTQRAYNRGVDATLDRNALAALVRKINAVEFTDATLLEVARKLNREYNLVFAFSPKVDLQSKLTGKLGPSNLRQDLTQLLDPLGLTFTVRSEAIVIAPKPK